MGKVSLELAKTNLRVDIKTERDKRRRYCGYEVYARTTSVSSKERLPRAESLDTACTMSQNRRQIAWSRNIPINICYHVKSGLTIIRSNSVSFPWSRYLSVELSLRRNRVRHTRFISMPLSYISWTWNASNDDRKKKKKKQKRHFMTFQALLRSLLTAIHRNGLYGVPFIGQSARIIVHVSRSQRNRKSEEERERMLNQTEKEFCHCSVWNKHAWGNILRGIRCQVLEKFVIHQNSPKYRSTLVPPWITKS